MFDLLIINPLTNLVLGFYEFFGENLGLAIIFFTIFLRIVLLPLTIKQIRQQKKMAELQPRLQELQANRKDPSQISGEEAALMRQTAGSCIGGCLPILVQFPILIGLNTVISKIASAQTGDVFNNVLYFPFLKHAADYRFHTSFLGFDLGTIPSNVPFLTKEFIPFGILIALLIITQFIQSKMMTFAQNKKKSKDANVKKKANEKKVKLSEKEKEKIETQEQMQKAMQTQMLYFVPILIGMASYSFAAALGIYWLTQNLFAIGQTYVQNEMSEGKALKEVLNAKSFIEKFIKRKESKIRNAEYQDIEEKKEKSVNKQKKKKKR